MFKIVTIGSWDFGQPAVEMVKVSSRGLRGADRTRFLEKRAASHVFADTIDKIDLKRGDIPIHLLAIGSSEAYGSNRNGDGFKEATNRKTHDRFVKHARYYRHHKNKDPDKSYGRVKQSAYNDAMRRIELLLIGNTTKEASRRNGGLVLPAATVERFEAGESVPFSMACKVAYDVCSNCGNKAANRKEYCTEDTCINPTTGFRGFGCKDGLTKIAENGFQQHVDNPDPHHFDISEVARPADRIAHGWKATYFQKAASEIGIMGGAELYEMYTGAQQIHDALWGPLLGPNIYDVFQRVPWAEKLAHDLAAIEARIQSDQTADDLSLSYAVNPAQQPPASLDSLGRLGSVKMATGLAALADQKIVLPVRDFLRLVTGDDVEKTAALSATVPGHLPGIYGRMIADGSLERYIRENPMSPGNDSPPSLQEKWAAHLAADFSLSRKAVLERIQRSVVKQASLPRLREGMEKSAAADEQGEVVARRYAAYKLSALARISPEDSDLEFTLELAVLQNMVH
jgi:hypothetical protein